MLDTSALSQNFSGLYMLSSYQIVFSGWDNWFHRNGKLKQQEEEDSFFVCVLITIFTRQELSSWVD